jgi:hypothetical protein
LKKEERNDGNTKDKKRKTERQKEKERENLFTWFSYEAEPEGG